MARISKSEREEINKKVYKPLMWIAIASIIMLFAGFSSGYIVSKADNIWIKIILPDEFMISSVIIVLSSITFYLGQRCVAKNKLAAAKGLIGLTLVLGVLFIIYQKKGFDQLNEKGSFFSNGKVSTVIEKGEYGKDYVLVKNDIELTERGGLFYDPIDAGYLKPIENLDFEKVNRTASYIFALTGIHIVHLIGGLLSLLFVFIKTLRGKYTPENYLGMQVSSIYWHFLDFLWLYLFAFLTFF
ncbi:MAG: cytochrome c oxidase subunit 3 [Bacteroidetes bacterium]|nr:cytochrome c oxidase subunit 3 [Bacteroidota bacterium]